MSKIKTEKSKLLTFTYVCLCFALVPLTSDYICTVFSLAMPFIYMRNNGNPLNAVNRSSKQTMFFGAFLLIQFIHVLRADYKVSGLGFAFLWLVMFMGYIFVSDLADTKGKIDKILFTSTVAGGIAGGIGVVQMGLYHYGGLINEKLRFIFNPLWDIFHEAIVKLMAVICPDSLAAHFGVDFDTVKVSSFATRACSTFSNPIFFAMFLVVVLPIALHCFFQLKENKWKRVISLFSALLIVAGIALSYSRGAYLAAMLAVFITLFCEKKQTIATVCVAPVVLLVVPSGVYKRLLTLVTDREDISLTTHAKIYQAAFETIKEHWLFGIGTGHAGFEEILHNDYGIKQPHAHNIFLEFLIEGGIIGAGLFAISLLLLVIGLVKIAVKLKESRPLSVTLIASLAGLVCCGMFDFVFYGPKPIQIFFMLAGLIEAVRRLYERNLSGDEKFEFDIKKQV